MELTNRLVLLIQNLYLFSEGSHYPSFEELKGMNTFQFYTWKPQLCNYFSNKIHFDVPRVWAKSDRFAAIIN